MPVHAPHVSIIDIQGLILTILLPLCRITQGGTIMTEVQPMDELSKTAVEKALEAIQPLIHRTPVFTSSSLSNALPGKNKLYFKAENMQKGGAFKFRGASYSLGRLTESQLSKGVCTHSSGMFLLGCYLCAQYDPSLAPGNHAGALALAAKERGVGCFVVMVSDEQPAPAPRPTLTATGSV